MTQPLQPTEPFAQHPRLAELINALHFQRYPLFLAGLLYEEPGGPLRQAAANGASWSSTSWSCSRRPDLAVHHGDRRGLNHPRNR